MHTFFQCQQFIQKFNVSGARDETSGALSFCKLQLPPLVYSYYVYIQAMWLMLQQEKPEDFVISMNEAHSVREFVVAAFKKVDIDIV